MTYTVYHAYGYHYFSHETEEEFQETKRFYKLFETVHVPECPNDTGNGKKHWRNARGNVFAWESE